MLTVTFQSRAEQPFWEKEGASHLLSLLFMLHLRGYLFIDFDWEKKSFVKRKIKIKNSQKSIMKTKYYKISPTKRKSDNIRK